jgi:heme A synthase
MALVSTEFLMGVSAILTDLPIAVAVAHNGLAALLLLALLKLLAKSVSPAD